MQAAWWVSLEDTLQYPPTHACTSPLHPLLLLQVVGVLKKEAMKTQSRELEKGAEYRQLLVQVRSCGLGCTAQHRGGKQPRSDLAAWQSRAPSAVLLPSGTSSCCVCRGSAASSCLGRA